MFLLFNLDDFLQRTIQEMSTTINMNNMDYASHIRQTELEMVTHNVQMTGTKRSVFGVDLNVNICVTSFLLCFS